MTVTLPVFGRACAHLPSDGPFAGRRIRRTEPVENGDRSSPAVDNTGAYVSYADQAGYRISRHFAVAELNRREIPQTAAAGPKAAGRLRGNVSVGPVKRQPDGNSCCRCPGVTWARVWYVSAMTDKAGEGNDMGEDDWLAGRFEAHRGRLHAVAYRMLGSLAEADDAVQETWLRLSRSGTADIENLAGWLTTVTGRVCLDMLRSRRARREEPLAVHVPDPIVQADAPSPEDETMLADSVGLALLVVLDTLAPAERLAFVLHDMFGVPFDEIGQIVGRSKAAAKMLASRARRRLQNAALEPGTDPGRQREVVGAFLAASRHGDFDALLAILDPDVVLRVDAGTAGRTPSKVVRGAAAVAAQAVMFSPLSRHVQPALVNGVPGLITAPGGQLVSVMGFTIRDGKIAELDILADPGRLAQLDLTILSD